MEAKYRAVSVFLLAVVVAIIAVSDQLSVLMPPLWATLFTVVILILREVVKAYGSELTGYVMDTRYRALSAALIIAAFGLIALEPVLVQQFPAMATVIGAIILIIRELVKDKGLQPENLGV